MARILRREARRRGCRQWLKNRRRARTPSRFRATSNRSSLKPGLPMSIGTKRPSRLTSRLGAIPASRPASGRPMADTASDPSRGCSSVGFQIARSPPSCSPWMRTAKLTPCAPGVDLWASGGNRHLDHPPPFATRATLKPI